MQSSFQIIKSMKIVTILYLDFKILRIFAPHLKMDT